MDGELANGGISGTFEVGDGACDPFVAAFRFWVLLVLPLPKP